MKADSKKAEEKSIISLILKGNTDSLLLLIIMLLLILSRLILSAFSGTGTRYCIAAVILELFCFAVPSTVYLYLVYFKKGRGVPNVRLSPPPLVSIPTVASSIFLMISGAILIVLLGVGGKDFSFSVYSSFEPGEHYGFGIIMLMIIAYALIPAVGEEFVFRGIFCSLYETHGLVPSALLSTLFFTLVHLNAAGFPVFVYAGLVLWLLLYATSSLYVTMGVHFVYNLFCLFGLPYISTYYGDSLAPELFLFIVTVIFLISGAAFCISNAWIYRKRAKKDAPLAYEPRLGGKEGLAFTGRVLVSAGSILSVAIYLIYALAQI